MLSNLGPHLNTSRIRSLLFPLSPCGGRTTRKLVNFITCYLVMMDLSIRLLEQVFMELVYLMILLMTYEL